MIDNGVVNCGTVSSEKGHLLLVWQNNASLFLHWYFDDRKGIWPVKSTMLEQVEQLTSLVLRKGVVSITTEKLCVVIVKTAVGFQDLVIFVTCL